MFRIPIFLFALAITMMAASARAQTEPPSTSATSPKPAPATQPPPFRSAFDGYQRFDAELPLTDWRKLHETVHQRGGWRAYAMESAKANAASAKPAGENK